MRSKGNIRSSHFKLANPTTEIMAIKNTLGQNTTKFDNSML